MMFSPEVEIARFLRRLKWYVLVGGVLWMAWLLTPVLIPFVLSVFLGWLGDPLVKRFEWAGVSRAMAVCFVFFLVVLLLLLVLMIFVPLIERQVVTLINTFPQMHDWVVNTVIPWVEQKTGSQLRTWLDPEQMIQWMHSNWEQAGAWPGAFRLCVALWFRHGDVGHQLSAVANFELLFFAGLG